VGLVHHRDRLTDPAQAWFIRQVLETASDLDG
jgi:hypothetical protein